tara:strand:+ start:648 stop:950 length:303 start_codon:yes stop_codon:yes gene_type:complete
MPVIEIDKETRVQVATWVTSQSFTNVLLAVIVGAIIYLGYYILSVAMPGALKDVQSGYESINKENREDRQKIRDDNERILNMILRDRGREPISDTVHAVK